MSDKKKYIQPKKLVVDKGKKYQIILPNGKKKVIELTNEEITTVENWFFLFGKHTIRSDIENILFIFNELNTTQISQMVKQSKSTVARHLRSMEEDGLLISRKAENVETGKIPPKLYKINKKLLQVVEDSYVLLEPPNDTNDLANYYKGKIQSYRTVIYRFMSILQMFTPLLDIFEEKIDNIPEANNLFTKYFVETSKSYSDFVNIYFSEKYYDKFMEAFNSYLNEIIRLLAIQNADPDVKERIFTAIMAILPIKELFEIQKHELLERK